MAQLRGDLEAIAENLARGLIALAKVSGSTVITEETGVGSLGKIPGVCNAMKVDCINLKADRRRRQGTGLSVARNIVNN
jgi:hypothetical protein